MGPPELGAPENLTFRWNQVYHHHGFYHSFFLGPTVINIYIYATPEATPKRPMARPPTPKSPRRPRTRQVHELPCEASRSAKMGEGRSDRNLYAHGPLPPAHSFSKVLQ